ncbi:MAG: hypothetical protein KF846_09045 [Cyclobacteriaceae bacterium]|nr:hypothetical protein [Cyclobacteriaceae bacterium]
MTTRYKPQTAKARPWDDIEEHYVDLNKHGWGHERLLELVKRIKSSGLRDRLFAYTSIDKLVVSIYDPIEWNREALHIQFDRQNQRWTFEYYAKPPGTKPESERQYSSDLGIDKFFKFIEGIKW